MSDLECITLEPFRDINSLSLSKMHFLYCLIIQNCNAMLNYYFKTLNLLNGHLPKLFRLYVFHLSGGSNNLLFSHCSFPPTLIIESKTYFLFKSPEVTSAFGHHSVTSNWNDNYYFNANFSTHYQKETLYWITEQALLRWTATPYLRRHGKWIRYQSEKAWEVD